MGEGVDTLPLDAQGCPADASCCEATIALVQRLSAARRCPACGEEYYPSPLARPSRPELPRRPGLDLREGDVPETASRRRAARSADEAPEIAEVRRMLCELRPETDGPLGWGPYDLPPGDAAPTAEPCRVQNAVADSEKHGGLPKGAFVRPQVDRLAQVRRRIAIVAAYEPETCAVLRHLQVQGTLAHGYGALCVGVAHAVADERRREAWRADAARAWDRARVWGARRTAGAAAAWSRSEAVDSRGEQW